MSLTNDYLKALNSASPKSSGSNSSGGNSLTSAYLQNVKKRKKDEDDIFSSDIAPVYSAKAAWDEEEDIAPVTKRKWFDSGAFEDGYDFGDITKTILGTGADLLENAGAGILGMGEAAVDALASIAPYVAKGQALQNGAYYNPTLQKAVDEQFNAGKEWSSEFVAKDLYNEADLAKRASKAILQGVDVDNYSVLGEKSDTLMQSAGQLAATVGLQAVGVPWFLTSGVTAFGGEAEQAFTEGATNEEAILSSAISAGAELLTEKLSGGIKFGGKALDDALTKEIARGVSNKAVRTLAKLGLDMSGEGAEEVLSGTMSALGQKITYADNKELSELFSSEDALESFIGGAVLGGGFSGINAIKSNKQGVDYTTGLTANEQKVIDFVYKNRLAEAEENGKVSSKEKSKIYDAVLRDMEKGYISTDTIEEALGGDTYKNYRDIVESEDAALKEYEELGKLQNATLAQQERYRELGQAVKDIKNNSSRDQFKTQLSDEVLALVKGDRLAESYNERSRRGQAFEADLSKYDAKQQAVIQKAIDSGILNNTNRTHEFVDIVAKISADKGVLFDFTNNEKLKESGFAIDGKQVNGFVTNDGITLNIDSPKAWQSTVGHEITHVLEGTEVYTELQNVLFEYSKNKGDFSNRRSNLEELYKDIKDADIDGELTADLVGEYLFTDTEFINRLSTEHRNIFQKIYDEIKYLRKVATAGSKEARELEKVKKAFEQAYKADSKAQSDTKYSISDSTGKELSKEQQDYFKDSKVRDENGSLIKVYHSSPTAGFHVFDGSEGHGNYKYSEYGDGITFFTDNKAMADSYSPSNEKVDTVKLNNLPDAQSWLESIGADYLEVRENNGVYELYDSDEAEVVQEYDSEEELLRELKRAVQEDYGDLYAGGQYEGYLNIKNPMVVDAEGRPWDRITEEFSQEVYDKFMSLTSEEKAALEDLAGWEDASLFVSEVRSAHNSANTQDEHAKALASAFDKLKDKDGYVNLFNLYDIAADGFTDEAIRESATVTLSTNDYVERALQAGTYDGVIIKNVIDYGGHAHSTFNSPPGNDYIAFNSNQFKAADNTKPTEDADIRYSLTEYSAEEKKAHNEAVLNYFGKTYKWAETGYVLLDGSRLDLSGKHEGAPGGYRTVDYRDIVDALGSDYGNGEYSGSLVQFMSEGNIRISPECNGINLSVKPTKAQEQSLSAFISSVRGEVLLDIDGLDGYTVVSVEYPFGTHANKVLNDIRGWFDNGTKPEGQNTFPYSLTKQGEIPKGKGTPLKDLALTQEDVAPVKETVAENTTVEFESNTISEGEELYNLENRKTELDKELAAAYEAEDFETFTKLDAEYASVIDRMAEIKSAERDRLESLKDAPLEVEAPYYENTEPVNPKNPFSDKNIDEDMRNYKSFVDENPDFKPLFQYEAEVLLQELNDTVKGERLYQSETAYELGNEYAWKGSKRLTSDDIAYLLDSCHYTYKQIRDGLNEIIEDAPTKHAVAKRIEFVINDRLLNGYTYFGTNYNVPANQDYIDLLNEWQINEDSRAAFDKFMENADAYAPPVEDVAPVKAAEEVAPTLEEVKIKGQGNVVGQKVMPDVKPEAPKGGKTANVLTEMQQNGKKGFNVWSWVKEHILDNGMVFEDVAKRNDNRELEAKWNMTRNAASMAQRLIGKGANGVKSLKDIAKEVSAEHEQQFLNYLYHVHNIDRMSLDDRFHVPNKAVFGDAVTADISRAEVKQYESAYPQFKEWAKDVYAYNKHLRNLLVDNGVISQETAALWEKMYPHYVPTVRVDDEGVAVNVPLDTYKTGVNAPVKSATGGNSDIRPLFDVMAQRTMQTYRAITRNSFGVELKNTLGSTVANDAQRLDDVIDGIDYQEELLKEGKRGANPTFTVFENGERVEFEITEEMYEALKPRSKAMQYKNKLLNGASDLFRNLTTQYNPTFFLTNPIKDVQDVLINSQHPGRTYANLPRSIIEQFRRGKYYQEYLANGGENNTYFDTEGETFAEKGIVEKGLDATVGWLNNHIEMTPRLAEYIASRQAGRSIDVAMLDAARVTTNFAAGGDVTKLLNRNGATFLNASVQGAIQQVRNVREAHHKGLMGYVGLATRFAIAGLPVLYLNDLRWGDDEEYEELKDYIKQGYYIVDKTEDGRFIRIPKGRTLAVIQDAFQQVSNALTGDDEVDLGSFLKLVADNIAPNNPLTNNIAAPLVQAYRNRAWYDGDIVPTRLQGLPATEQFDHKTDALSIKASKALSDIGIDISPYKINYVLNQYSGGVGDMLLPFITPKAESSVDTAGGKLLAPLRDKFMTDPVFNNKNTDDFYALSEDLEVQANSAYATDEDKLKSMFMLSESYELSDLYKKQREIQSSDLPDSQKYANSRAIQKQINEAMEKALGAYGTVNIDGLYAEVGDRRFDKNESNGKWYEIDPEYDPNGFYEREQKAVNGFGISYGEYWNNREMYDDAAYLAADKGIFETAKNVFGAETFASYASDLSEFRADYYENGNSIPNSKKKKIANYVYGLNISEAEKHILFKSQYPADDTYNMEIIDYLNGRDDINYSEMEAILKELGFEVDAKGHITWD